MNVYALEAKGRRIEQMAKDVLRDLPADMQAAFRAGWSAAIKAAHEVAPQEPDAAFEAWSHVGGVRTQVEVIEAEARMLAQDGHSLRAALRPLIDG